MADPEQGKRLAFIDGLRGAAIIPMVLNHTGRSWLNGGFGAGATFTYLTVTTAAPVFMFLAGFSATLSWRRAVSTGLRYRSWAGTVALRSAWLVVLGYALNRVLFPGKPLLFFGPLQAIGLTLLVLIPVVPFLVKRKSKAPSAILIAIALATYLPFAYRFESLRSFIFLHPGWGEMFFFSMPVWPWSALILLGAAEGARWCADSEESGRETILRRWAFAGAGLVLAGLLAVAAFGWRDYTLFFTDFSTWFPGPATAIWIAGLTPALLFAFRKWEELGHMPGILMTLGRHALLIYVVHRALVITVIAGWLRFTTSTWLVFYAANAALLLLLAALATASDRFKARQASA